MENMTLEYVLARAGTGIREIAFKQHAIVLLLPLATPCHRPIVATCHTMHCSLLFVMLVPNLILFCLEKKLYQH